jgi:hypothetical protein
MAFVCVQPLRVHHERVLDNYTWDKTDHKDAILIGRVIAQGACYLAERPVPAWARLRHLGATRSSWVARSAAHQLADRRSSAMLLASGAVGSSQPAGVGHVGGMSGCDSRRWR